MENTASKETTAKQEFANLIEKGKKYFGMDKEDKETKEPTKEDPKKEEKKVKFVDVSTDDGKTIRVAGEVTIGASVTWLDADGNEVPVPDGDYTLDTGMVLKIEGGAILAVTEASEETKKEEENKKEEKDESKDASELRKEIEDLKAEQKSQKEYMAVIFEVIKRIGQMPSTDETSKKKSKYGKEVNFRALQEEFRNDIKKLQGLPKS